MRPLSRSSLILSIGALVLLAVTMLAFTTSARPAATASNIFRSFPTPLSSSLPYDVDTSQVDQLDATGSVPEAQRLFDIFSWQNFLALNWPANAQGNPDRHKTLADAGPRVWDSWRTADSIFLPQGAKPTPWNTAERSMAANVAPVEDLFRAKAAWRQHATDADENFQAFSGPLVDQNGNWVRYEVLVNHVEFDYIFQNQLYNLEGQADFSRRATGNEINFPGNVGTSTHGATEIKLAWKELGPHDDPSRFYTTKASVIVSKDEKSGGPSKKIITVGLVGMHIAVRTQSSPEWVWATFEQVDNVQADDLEHIKGGDTRRPNFNNPEAPSAAVNILPPKNAVFDPVTGQPTHEDDPTKATTWIEDDTKSPVQVTRVIPIPLATAALNRDVQSLLRAQHSVFQYYELVGTQWPIHPNAPAFAGGEGSAPESIDHKMPGDMVPVYLTNTTMETYFQKGAQPAGALEQDDRLAQTAPPIDGSPVFGTESCVGCHYSAGACLGFKKDRLQKDGLARDVTGHVIPIYGENGHFGKTGNAHFSWLLQIEAHSTHDPAPPPPSPAAFLDIGSHPDQHTLPAHR